MRIFRKSTRYFLLDRQVEESRTIWKPQITLLKLSNVVLNWRRAVKVLRWAIQ